VFFWGCRYELQRAEYTLADEQLYNLLVTSAKGVQRKEKNTAICVFLFVFCVILARGFKSSKANYKKPDAGQTSLQEN
jgi:hypothetical protein